jgi:anaerobic selenocysteine-containing dehydrogenase/Fe-S-cluster-containing dehydrogenase component
MNKILPANSAPADNRLALLIDLERCIGCKSCEVACKQEHGLGPSERRNRVVWQQGQVGEGAPVLSFLPIMCQHCDRPACLRACPVNPKAIRRDVDTGVVIVDEQLCTGCGECVMACPYDAMGFDPVGYHAVKCDLCETRRSEDRTTACAEVCPGMAIKLGNRTDLLSQSTDSDRNIKNHDAFLLGPAAIYLDRQEDKLISQEAMTVPNISLPRSRGQVPDNEETAFPYGLPREIREADRIEAGSCTICFNSCSLNYHLRGDQLVGITGNIEDPILSGRVCPKSQMMVQFYNDSRRLTKPLKRVGERGEGQFEPISWDQALDEIAERLKLIAEEWGKESLAIFAGTRSGIMTIRGYVNLFGQLWGTPNVEGTDPFCASAKTLAYTLTQGSAIIGSSYTEDDIGSAGMYLYLGDNQGETRPVYFGMVNDWRIRNKTPMVVVDPRYTVTASKADRWLAIRSGTDMALGLALAHHILSRNLHDQEFCEKWLEGWSEWRDYIFERGYRPEWAAEITDIPAAEICRLAEEIAAADGCMIIASRGINQHSNGVQTNRVLMYLAAITGNWGRPGGGFMNMTSAPAINPEVPEERRAPVQKPKVRRNPAAWVNAMKEGKPYPIRALITGNNPMVQWSSQETTREAFKALDLIVHIDLYKNETSAFADYVLPVATGIERGGLSRANDDRRMGWNDKLIDPPGDAKSDAWIWTELGKRFGYDDVLKEEYKDPAVFWDEVLCDSDDLRGCTTERMRSTPHKWVRFPLKNKDAREQETLYLEAAVKSQPGGKRFPTPSGRLEFWTAKLEDRFNRIGLSALPEFYSEQEQLIDLPHLELLLGDDEEGVISPFQSKPTGASPARIVDPGKEGIGAKLKGQGFNMELVTGRPPAPHFHSWTHYLWQAQEMWPDLYAQIHPDTADDLGIKDGQRLRIETPQGKMEALAWLTPGIRKTSVFVPIGWGERQPHNPWQSVNFLTDSTQRDPIADQVNLKTLLCRVEGV